MYRKHLRRTDVESTREMRELFNDSSSSTRTISTSSIKWTMWKGYLKKYYLIPGTLKINSYYRFFFTSANPNGDVCRPGTLSVREYSTSLEWKRFNIKTLGVVIENSGPSHPSIFTQNFKAELPSLSRVFISKGVTRNDYLLRHVHEKY